MRGAQEEIENTIKKIMATVLNVPIDTIDNAASVRTIESWKGRNHFKLVEALQSGFGIQFDDSEIETLINYTIIRATILAYLI